MWSPISLLVTVLEAFHFDHETLTSEMEAAKSREGESHLKFCNVSFSCFRAK